MRHFFKKVFYLDEEPISNGPSVRFLAFNGRNGPSFKWTIQLWNRIKSNCVIREHFRTKSKYRFKSGGQAHVPIVWFHQLLLNYDLNQLNLFCPAQQI